MNANYIFEKLKEALAHTTRNLLQALPENDYGYRMADKLLQREQIGYAKYGVTMNRRDYTKHDWLLHLQEELMDGAQYAMAAGMDEYASSLLSDAIEIQKEIDRLV